MTDEELLQAQVDYDSALHDAEDARQARNAAVLEALAEGWSHARIAEATELSRGRISHIAKRLPAG